MALIPMLRFWRDVRTGAAAGAVVAVAITLWRVTREGELGLTALGMLGMVVGALVALTLGISRLQAWQDERGQELLQLRRGGLRNPCHYLRPSVRTATGRFDRERDAALTH